MNKVLLDKVPDKVWCLIRLGFKISCKREKIESECLCLFSKTKFLCFFNCFFLLYLLCSFYLFLSKHRSVTLILILFTQNTFFLYSAFYRTKQKVRRVAKNLSDNNRKHEEQHLFQKFYFWINRVLVTYSLVLNSFGNKIKKQPCLKSFGVV